MADHQNPFVFNQNIYLDMLSDVAKNFISRVILNYRRVAGKKYFRAANRSVEELFSPYKGGRRYAPQENFEN